MKWESNCHKIMTVRALALEKVPKMQENSLNFHFFVVTPKEKLEKLHHFHKLFTLEIDIIESFIKRKSLENDLFVKFRGKQFERVNDNLLRGMSQRNNNKSPPLLNM